MSVPPLLIPPTPRSHLALAGSGTSAGRRDGRIDLLDGVAQLVVGVGGGQLELSDQAVNLRVGGGG